MYLCFFEVGHYSMFRNKSLDIYLSELGHHWFRQWIVTYIDDLWFGSLIEKSVTTANMQLEYRLLISIRMSGWPYITYITWWPHQMETFSTLLAICAGNSLVAREFPTQRPVMQSFDVFFELRLNKPLSKQSWGCHFNDSTIFKCVSARKI